MKTRIVNQERLVFIVLTIFMIFLTMRGTTYGANLDVGDPRTVRMIYFLPNDRPYNADVVQRMKDRIRTVQTFYAEQMQAHGYGAKTFRIETDAKGEPMVHRLNGEHPFSRYDNSLGNIVLAEIERIFDFDENVYFIVLGAEALRQVGGEPVEGVGRPLRGAGGTKFIGGGAALFANEFSWQTAAHELGHVFGLLHDFRDDAYIMSYGPGQNRLSACSAGFLAVHPYFNLDTPIEEESPPAVEFISQQRTYLPGTTNITVQLKVSDSEGLHQVLLFVGGGGQLKAWQALEGEQDAVVEFEYDGVIPSHPSTSFSDPIVHVMRAMVVDTDGNVSWESFGLSEVPLSHITSLSNWGPVSSEKFSLDSATSVVFSPDGTTLAVGSRSTRLWNMATRELVATLTADWNFVNSVAFSPDGKLLASAISELKDNWVVNGTIQLWDMATQQNVATLIGHTHYIRSVAFSPDGKLLASGSWDDTIKLWDITTKQNIATLKADAIGVDAIAFSPDGKLLASAVTDGKNGRVVGGRVQLWDVATQQNIVTFGGLEHGAYSVAFSPDGKLLASGDGDGTIKLWDVTTKKHISDLSEHTGWIESVAFSPDGAILASGARDHTVKLWNVKTRASIATLKGHTRWVQSVAFSPDGAILASGAHRGVVMLWDVSKEIKGLTEVNIPDAALRAKIAETLGKPSGTQLTVKDMLALRELKAPNANIHNLTGLEYARYLTKLDLGSERVTGKGYVNSNTISNFSLLAELTNLKTLNLSSSSLSDVSFLSGLAKLTSLNLEKNTISDVSALSNLTQLRTLDLFDNSISDISALSGLTQLINLRLADTQVSDISPLAGLKQLDILVLMYTNVSDISALSGLTQLTYLGLSGASISDISPLAGLTQLTRLDLFDNAISDVSALTGLTQLTDLDISDNPLNYASINTHIPAMQAKGIEVKFDNVAHPALLKVSGDGQEGTTDAALATLFIVEAIDAQGKPMQGVSVTFTVTTGGGQLSVTTVTSDTNGRAETSLTLGPNPGVNKVRVSTTGITYPVTFTAIATETTRLAADVNGDSVVNVLDLVVVAVGMRQGIPKENDPADVNGDGVVNIIDLVTVAGAIGGEAAAPAAYPEALEMFTTTDIQRWLTQGQHLSLTDATSRKGIHFLEQLLASLIPKKTVLLPNYPNPFNPETWIPYQLTVPSNGTLHIYAVNGELVRSLVLGHQPAGMYHSKNRAAYWDGRNAYGEMVASGVYFYALTAGDFTATRKMLIRK